MYLFYICTIFNTMHILHTMYILNYDDICMCVVYKQFEILKFVLIPFMLTCSIIIFISRLLLGMCACVVCVDIWLT